MGKLQGLTRIVWAVDPFIEDLELKRRTHEAITALSGLRPVEVEPVSIVHWGDRYAMSSPPSSLADIETAAAESLEKIRKHFGAAKLLPGKIISLDTLSLGSAVMHLVAYAKETRADLIAVGTRSKHGTSRFLLGSFAETLVLQSDVPSVIVSPQTKPIQSIDHILFPIDFSDEASSGFRLLVTAARDIGASVILFHRDTRDDLAGAERNAVPFLAEARKLGVEIQFLVESHTGSVAESILKQSEERPATMIAMTSKAGPVGALLLGSVTRQVIRQSICPVWVLHPRHSK